LTTVLSMKAMLDPKMVAARIQRPARAEGAAGDMAASDGVREVAMR